MPRFADPSMFIHLWIDHPWISATEVNPARGSRFLVCHADRGEGGGGGGGGLGGIIDKSLIISEPNGEGLVILNTWVERFI